MSTLHKTIVTAKDLAAHPEWRVFDCSHEISDPMAGAAAYAEAHIPGALHARMEAVLSGPRVSGSGRNPLPDPANFAAWLGSVGVNAEDQIVCYDRGGNAAASRMWWMLRWVGHERVAVLDGAMEAWVAAGLPLTDAAPEFVPTVFPFVADDACHVDLDFIAACLGREDIATVDARGAEKFAGVNETTDPRGGHIPGALNRPYTKNIGERGLFKAPQELRGEWLELLGDVSPTQLIASCGSGVSACHNLLALEIAGLSGARLYPGSWSEWCADPARPIET